jgi:hypothetical protein
MGAVHKRAILLFLFISFSGGGGNKKNVVSVGRAECTSGAAVFLVEVKHGVEKHSAPLCSPVNLLYGGSYRG